MSSHHKLCLSLMPESQKELNSRLDNSVDADLIEIRIDKIKRLSYKEIFTRTKKPLVIALRGISEGGEWKGSNGDRLKLMQAAAKAGVAYVDIALDHAEALLPKLKLSDKTRVILSHHTDLTTLDALKEKLDEMAEIPAAVYKLVFKANSLGDNKTALQLMQYARKKKLSFVIHAMESNGQLSRFLGAIKGNLWNYVTPDESTETTAGGQFSLHVAKNVYYLPKKSANTRILGLVGNPLQQSKSWRLHNRLIDQSPKAGSQDYLYLNFPTEDIETFWEDWNDQLHGLSVTIPFKEQVIPFADKISLEVRISGVCNTLVRENGSWMAHNTDLAAIEALIRPYRESFTRGGMVIGTGATARSAVAALKRLEVNPIFMVGRNVERGKMLAETFGIDFLEEDEVHYAGASVIVQTTPVGMVPYTENYPVGTSLFRKGRLVLDVVYNPAETRYLQIAVERGCIPISGVEMFLLQAARQFELFTGRQISPEKIRDVWNDIV